ncbi:MAG: hypothetical protein K1X79_09420 [Oligoflexia bacterium]|nr:hypothetical protein [Oligoflexia bacterium]
MAIIRFLPILVCALGVAACSDAQQMKIPRTYEECLGVPHTLTRSVPPACVSEGGIIFRREGSIQPICVDRCGDGTCEEIVCAGSGCPCPETNASCPKDCPAAGHE